MEQVATKAGRGQAVAEGLSRSSQVITGPVKRLNGVKGLPDHTLNM